MPHLARLGDLERSALARWLQIDLEKVLKRLPHLHGQSQDCGAFSVSRCMRSAFGGWMAQGDFILNPNAQTCFYIHGAKQSHLSFFVVGIWLNHVEHGDEWAWSRCSWPASLDYSDLSESDLCDFCRVTFAQDLDVLTLIR